MPRRPTSHVIGKIQIGLGAYDVVADPNSDGGWFRIHRPGRTGCVCVGVDAGCFAQVLAVFLHEVQEATMVGMRLGLSPDFDRSPSNGDCRVFHLNHEQFTEVVARAAWAADQVLPDLRRAWAAAGKARNRKR